MSQYSNYSSFKWEKPMKWETFDSSNVPEKPGFYVFTNFDGPLKPTHHPAKQVVFYVGQTVNLHQRLRDHKSKNTRLAFQSLVLSSQEQTMYIRWAVDERASIERDLIAQLQAVHNDKLNYQ